MRIQKKKTLALWQAVKPLNTTMTWPVSSYILIKHTRMYCICVCAYTNMCICVYQYAYTRIGLTHITHIFWFGYIWAALYLHSNFSELLDWNTINNSCRKFPAIYATDLSHSCVPADITSKWCICRKWNVIAGKFTHKKNTNTLFEGWVNYTENCVVVCTWLDWPFFPCETFCKVSGI